MIKYLFLLISLGAGSVSAMDVGTPSSSSHSANPEDLLRAIKTTNNSHALILIPQTNLAYQNIFGYSPLHVAALHGNITLVQALIQAGASLDLKDHEGSTPLWRALEARSFAPGENVIPACVQLILCGATLYTGNDAQILKDQQEAIKCSAQSFLKQYNAKYFYQAIQNRKNGQH